LIPLIVGVHEEVLRTPRSRSIVIAIDDKVSLRERITADGVRMDRLATAIPALRSSDAESSKHRKARDEGNEGHPRRYVVNTSHLRLEFSD
jgi:hypothetical protein